MAFAKGLGKFIVVIVAGIATIIGLALLIGICLLLAGFGIALWKLAGGLICLIAAVAVLVKIWQWCMDTTTKS